MTKKLKLLLYLVLLLGVIASSNWIIQAYRNPAIMVGLLSGDSYKSSRSTWQVYQHLFEEHATDMMTAQFLAGLAQAESAGNPLVVPEWKWRLTSDVTRIYAPASTSAGLYQYTKPTFMDAKRFCIHNHQVAVSKKLPNLTGCWFNSLYSRFWPSHAVEMTSARLHYYVSRILKKNNLEEASLQNKQKLAALVHLCGVTKGERFAKAKFSFNRVSKCGSHSTLNYVKRVEKAMSRINSLPNKLFDKIF